MKFIIILLVIFLFTSHSNFVYSQKTIEGRILDEFVETLPGAGIFNQDKVKLGETDADGFFKVTIPDKSNKLIFGFIGCEWASITISDNCDYLEVILMYDGTYDFMSSRKIDRIRKKRFDKLGELHHLAVTKGLFKKDSVCFNREFVPEKPELDEIHKLMIQQLNQNKKTFAEFEVGDTIRIPFSPCTSCDGTDRTSLSYYSYTAEMKNYDCIIEGLILDKNRHRGGHNIVFKVINCDLCKKNLPILNGKEMIPGAVFEYDIVYFKILKE